MINKRQMLLDFLVIIMIAFAIYYLKIQSGDADMYGPVSGFQAIVGLGG